MSPLLRKLYSLFGPCAVLLAVHKGTKKPVASDWQHITVNATRNPKYQAELESCITREGNIGVVLGPASGSLVSIDLDRDELVTPFLAINPMLAATTRTRGKRGCNFFVFIKPGTRYPNSKATYAIRDKDGVKCGEWRCGGGDKGAQTIVFGLHPDGPHYQIEVEAPPVTISFDELQWFYAFDQAPPTSGNAGNGNSQANQAGRGASVAFDPQAAYGRLLAELGEPFIKSQRSYSINQPFFARLFGINRLALYDRVSKDYYAYNPVNGLYERLCEEMVHQLIEGDIFAEATGRGFPTVGSKISITLLKSIAGLVKSDQESSKEDFFLHGAHALPVIHAANGMWQLEQDGTLTRHDFSPDFRSRNMILIPYNPDAKCPRFTGELLEPVLQDKADIDALQRYYGLILIGNNRAQQLLMLLGEGGAGKGTIVRLVGMVLGRTNVGQLRISELNGRFETSKLVGKLLLNVVEATSDCLDQRGAEVLKALVGHDLMDGEKKYIQAPIQFEGTFAIIYVSNEDPNIRLSGDESAWSRRLIVIQFPKRPAGSAVIANFEEVLYEAEAEGIFTWMVEGAKKHWAELVAGKVFSTTGAQKRRVEEIIARSKSITTFVLDGLSATTTGDLTADELYDGYVSFCIDRKWNAYPERKFAEIVRPLVMKHFGIGQSHDINRVRPNGKTTSQRGYSGLEINVNIP